MNGQTEISGSVITGADVKEIVLRSGRATAIRLADGGAVEGSRFIASAIDAPTTMRMAGEDLFPEDVRRKLNGWHWGSHSLVTPPRAARQADLGSTPRSGRGGRRFKSCHSDPIKLFG